MSQSGQTHFKSLIARHYALKDIKLMKTFRILRVALMASKKIEMWVCNM